MTKSGQHIRYGKIIEDLDAMAGDCSYKYLMQSQEDKLTTYCSKDFYLVTVSVDRVDFLKKL